MKLAYVDTSCLAAIAFDEPRAPSMKKKLGGFARVMSSNLLEAELRAALSREHVQEDCADLLSWINWIFPDRPLTPEFREVLSVGHARGADLWHLAAAVYARRRLRRLQFLTLDRRQAEIARGLGFDG
ncbi:MAG: PIN domain-containing protein [bacterium]|nr:PIN domain-containing protein [bacterium]